MIVEAGFEIARELGLEKVSARPVSERLGCSTQPVMYHFKTIEELRKAVYQRADAYHTAEITKTQGDHPMLDIGLNYIRFAHREQQLFRLLFQSNGLTGKSLSELMDAEETVPLIMAVSQAAGIDAAQAKRVFRMLFLFVHGYASVLANNALVYEESVIAADLRRAFMGAVCMSKEETP